MNVVGIDFSTKSIDAALVFADGRSPMRWTADVSGLGAWDAALIASGAVRSPTFRMLLGDADVCVFERPYSVGRSTVAALMRMQGIVLGVVPASLRRFEVAPQAWKKAIGLRPNASKGEVAEWARAMFGDAVKLWSQDSVDALGIACAGRELD